jgi:hypothetical protein
LIPYLAPIIANGGIATAEALTIIAFLNNGKNVIYLGSTFATAGISSIFAKLFSKFMKAIKNAKLSGELLGIAISLGLVCANQTISLSGFSLGSQVTKSCLETLYDCKAHNVVHQTVFMAGATHFNANEEAVKWNDLIFGNTVSG